MCGVVGLLLADTESHAEVSHLLFESLFFLQHRGQDACGISTCGAKGRVYQCKGNGMAAKVFQDGARVVDLPGYIFLDEEAHRHVNTDSDSELMLNIFANALNETGKARVNVEDIFRSLKQTYQKCQGAFAVTGMIAGFGILAFRDANGIRPLLIGTRPSATIPGATDYMIASESIALRQLGFKNYRDILPGEAVFIQKGGKAEFKQVVERKSYTPDIFEYVYFARPDSVLDSISIHKSRQNMGFKLADKIRETIGEEGVRGIDVIIPVPETSNTAAAVVSERLKIPLSAAFTKNRFVGRTFILPGQKLRQKSVRRKLSAIESEFMGRTVCLVDDSIVRGTTSKEIVSMAREAGAVKVYFASCAPPLVYPHIYGIDLASPHEMIAHEKSREDIAQLIGADDLIYQDLHDLKQACIEAAPNGGVKEFEVGVFCGNYQTIVPEGYFDHLDEMRHKNRPERTGGLLDGTIPASSNPVNGAGVKKSFTLEVPANTLTKNVDLAALLSASNAPRTPENREDISIHNIASEHN
ncbi:amidophosphoribosyltransferase-like protein [Xylaria sp. FL1042]|nr:amidophosphoribosyltransferase-like protein [Xylaria sp. FL1042]